MVKKNIVQELYERTDNAILKSWEILLQVIYDKKIESIDKVEAIKCLIDMRKNIKWGVKE